MEEKVNLHKLVLNDLIAEDYYVYEHELLDEVFYVGKGKGDRAFNLTPESRNKMWREIVEGRIEQVKVRIVGRFANEHDAFMFEKAKIKHYVSHGYNLANIVHNEENMARFLSINKGFDNYLIKPLREYGLQSLENFSHEIFSDTNEILDNFDSFLADENRLLIVSDNLMNIFKIEQEVLLRGYSSMTIQDERLVTMSKRKVLDVNNCLKQLREVGTFPEKYDILIITSSIAEDLSISDDSIKNFIIDDNNLSIQLKVLNIIDHNKVKFYLRTNKVKKQIKRLIVPKEYLSVRLTSKEKSKLCAYFKLKDKNGRELKWTSISRRLLAQGYAINNTQTVGKGKRIRASIITLPI